MIRPMQIGAIDEKGSKGIEIPFKSLYGQPPEIHFHTVLQKAKGQVVG
jgi:hypothetical protein